MADYYSLLSRAIANLPKSSTPTARKAIYDRARKALNNQLRSLKPPLPESDILREESALDDAMRRIESGFDVPMQLEAAPVPQAVAPAPQAPPPAPKPAPAVAAPAPQPARPPAPPPLPARPPAPRPTAPPAAPPAAKVAPPPQPAPVAPPPEVIEPPPAPVVAAQTQAPVAAAPSPPVRPTLPRAPEKPAPKVFAQTQAPVATAAPIVPAPTLNEPEPSYSAPLLKPAMPLPATREPEPSRPIAPRADETTSRGGMWKWLLLAAAIGFIGMVAVAAFLLRSQNAQDLALHYTKPTPTPTETAGAGPKIIERVGGGEAPSPTPTQEASAQPTPAATPTPTPAATPTPSPTGAVIATPDAAPSPAATPPAAQIPPSGSVRAAFLLATPQDVQKPTVVLGNVTWSSPPANPGQGGGPGVRADIDVPDLKFHAVMLLRKNTDPALPASHTIDLRLSFDDGASFKGVKDVGVPQMRREDAPAPTPLLGVRVVINDSYFLIGLNRADADVQRNMEAIASGEWFDFPMLLPDGRIAKLTFEKGADGEKIIASALAAWK